MREAAAFSRRMEILHLVSLKASKQFHKRNGLRTLLETRRGGWRVRASGQKEQTKLLAIHWIKPFWQHEAKNIQSQCPVGLFFVPEAGSENVCKA